MKIIITGSLGNISKPLTKELVQKGHDVTVISSKAERQKDIETIGAKAAIGSVEDADFLAAAFRGADAVYTMLPPPDFSDTNLDLKSHTLRIANNYAYAIKLADVKRVVQLSSVGAHLEKGTGYILIHRAVEEILNNLSDVSITFMRPVGFYYNLKIFIGSIKASGLITSNYGAEDIIPWVSPIDIGTAIAEEILTLSEKRKIRYVASEELSCNETANILGVAIGKPDLKWTLISDEELLNRYEAFGMNKTIASYLVEMQANMHNGPFYDDYYLNRPVLGKTKLAEFAKEFAVNFNN